MQPGRPHDPNCVGREAGTDLSVRFVLMMHHRSAVTVVTVVEAVVRLIELGLLLRRERLIQRLERRLLGLKLRKPALQPLLHHRGPLEDGMLFAGLELIRQTLALARLRVLKHRIAPMIEQPAL